MMTKGGLPIEGPEIAGVTFQPPTDLVRFYHARIVLTPSGLPYRIARARVDGEDRTFVPYLDGWAWYPHRDRQEGNEGAPDSVMPAGKEAVLHVKCPWQPGRSYPIEVEFTAPLQGAEGRGLLQAAATAPPEGGFPYPGWQEHRVLVLVEEHGLERAAEPVILFLSDEARIVGSFENEVRIAQLDPATGNVTEVPSQVLYEKAKASSPSRQPAVRTCQVAFLADVPAGGRAYYLVAYGNARAEKPSYASDLLYSVAEDGTAWVENEFYRVQLHKPSGQINGMVTKRFAATGNGKIGFARQFPLHYNPDIWVTGRRWTHTRGWAPPPHSELCVGPLAIVTRRWGALPKAPEVEVNVTYSFFSKAPYVLVDSTVDVVKDVVANALRNDVAVVTLPEQIDHVGWKDPGGTVHYKPAEADRHRTHGMMGTTSSEAPYVCLVRQAQGWGLAGIQLQRFYGTRAGAPAVLVKNHTSLADYGWGFCYWSRVLAHPWGDYQPDRPNILNAGTFYCTRAAYCPFPLREGTEPQQRLAYVERLGRLLRSPLRIDHQGAGPW